MKTRTLTLVVGALLLVLAGFWLQRPSGEAVPGGTAVATRADPRGAPPPAAPSAPGAQPVTRVFPRAPGPGAPPSTESGVSDLLRRLLAGDADSAEVPREVIQQWLESGHTNAQDLLAARQAGGGVEFLRRALAEFPNDPRVLQAAVALDDGPAARRELLDRFQAHDPDNALADYLSARDHFKAGRAEEALADLAAAGAKRRFDDYTDGAMQSAEDLFLAAGRTPLEATVLGSSGVLLPHLAQLKGLAQDLAALEREYVAAGDPDSAHRLAVMGAQLGQQLSEGEGSRYLINQLVGIAVQKLVLAPLDPATAGDAAPATVGERLARIEARRAELKADGGFVEGWLRGASEPELIGYFNRLKLEGEPAAIAWARQQSRVP